MAVSKKFSHALERKDISLLLTAFDDAVDLGTQPDDVPAAAVDMLIKNTHLDHPEELIRDPLAALEATAALSELPRYTAAGLVSEERIAAVFTGAVRVISDVDTSEILAPALAGIIAAGFRSGLVRRASELTAALKALEKALEKDCSVPIIEAICAVIGSPVAAAVDRPAAAAAVTAAIDHIFASTNPVMPAACLGALGNAMVYCFGPDSKVSANGQRAAAEYLAEYTIPTHFATAFDRFWRAANPEFVACLLRFVRGCFLHPLTASAVLAAEGLLVPAMFDAADRDRTPEVMRWRYECARAMNHRLKAEDCPDLLPHRDDVDRWLKQGPFPAGIAGAVEVATVEG